MSGEEYYSFEKAVGILKEELQYPEERALHFVKQFDTNKDGKLSATEFDNFLLKINETKVTLVPKFKEYDRDGNGYITLEEASAILQGPPFNFPGTKVLTLLTQFDKDHNGKLDIEEFSGFYAEAKATHQQVSRKFDELDKDGNGVLSPDEVEAAISESMGRDKKTFEWMMLLFDQNKDGNIDKTEFIELWSSMFQ